MVEFKNVGNHGVLYRQTVAVPLGMSESYCYDVVGNLSGKTDFNGQTTTYSYDTLNRLLKKTPDSSLNQPTISFAYTLTGQRLSMTDPSGTSNYSLYDNRDRLKTQITPEGTLLNYTYDAHGNVSTIASSNTNGASMTYQYDADNRLSQVTDNRIAGQGGPSSPTTYSYDPTGNLTGYAYPNAVQTAKLFDPLNRLTQTCSATSSPACSAGTKLSSFAYTLGLAGNRTAVSELSGRHVAYGYDADYLLSSETITSDPNSGSESYTYDVVGNRKTVSSTIPPLAGSTTSSYDSNDFLTTDTPDANGNTTSSGGVSNTYDFENRMTAHGTTTMVYDGDGNRVSETAGRPRNIWWTRSTPRACRRCRKPEGTPGEINDHGGLFTVRGDEAETRFQGWASGPAVASIKTFGDPGGAAACASDLFARSFGCIDSPESGAPYWGGLLGRVCCWV